MSDAIQPSAAALPVGGIWTGAWALWHREMIRFFRQKNRVVSVLLTPMLLWVGLGAGLNQAITVGGGEMGGEAASGVITSGGGATSGAGI